MTRDLKSLYVAIVDNEVICFETNLKRFVEMFTGLEPKSRNYAWFYRSFDKQTRFELLIDSKQYFMQKVK